MLDILLFGTFFIFLFMAIAVVYSLLFESRDSTGYFPMFNFECGLYAVFIGVLCFIVLSLVVVIWFVAKTILM